MVKAFVKIATTSYISNWKEPKWNLIVHIESPKMEEKLSHIWTICVGNAAQPEVFLNHMPGNVNISIDLIMLRDTVHNVTNQNLKIQERSKCKNRKNIGETRNLNVNIFIQEMEEVYNLIRMECVSNAAGIEVYSNLTQPTVNIQIDGIKAKVYAHNAIGIGIARLNWVKKIANSKLA